MIGRFFTGRFVLGVDETDYLIEVSRERSSASPRASLRTTSAMISGCEPQARAWAYFSQPVPPPMYNDIWAMAHPLHNHLTIEGNTLPFWQNLRALTRMLSLMRAI